MMSNRVKSVFTTSVLATAASGFLAGCGEEEVEQEAYCVNDTGQVVNEQMCDTDGGGGLFFLYLGNSGSHRVGDRIPAGSSLIRHNDPVARSKAGLPATGKATGRVVGGIGKGVGGGTGEGGKGAGS